MNTLKVSLLTCQCRIFITFHNLHKLLFTSASITSAAKYTNFTLLTIHLFTPSGTQGANAKS